MGAVTLSVLGLDIGRRRIGVAGCDGTGLIATGLLTIERRGFAEDLALLQRLVQERRVSRLVVGMPYSREGEIGFQGKQVRRLAERFGKALGLPIDYVDEKLTSYAAEQLLWASGRSPADHKALIDRKAAAIILQDWLDLQRSLG